MIIGWQHLCLATAASEKDSPFHRGLLQSARYWAATELPRVALLADRCRRDRSYLELDPDWL